MRQAIETLVLDFMQFFDATAVPFFMDHALPLFLFYGLPGLIMIAVTCFLLGVARGFKGTVELKLPQAIQELGTVITGEALVTAKKPIIIERIDLSVIAQTNAISYDEDGSHITTTRVYHSKQSQPLLSNLKAGISRSFPIRVQLPSANLAARDERRLRKAYAAESVDFVVEIRLQCQGLDLLGAQTIAVQPAATARPKPRSAADRVLDAHAGVFEDNRGQEHAVRH